MTWLDFFFFFPPKRLNKNPGFVKGSHACKWREREKERERERNSKMKETQRWSMIREKKKCIKKRFAGTMNAEMSDAND